MAVAVLMEFSEGTMEQYDQIIEKMGLSDGHAAPHGIFHVCGPTEEGGVRIVDVWESAEAYKDFAETQIGPIAASVGITEQPKVTVWPVHNTLSKQGHLH